jgi:hypothetical protein
MKGSPLLNAERGQCRILHIYCLLRGADGVGRGAACSHRQLLRYPFPRYASVVQVSVPGLILAHLLEWPYCRRVAERDWEVSMEIL